MIIFIYLNLSLYNYVHFGACQRWLLRAYIGMGSADSIVFFYVW